MWSQKLVYLVVIGRLFFGPLIFVSVWIASLLSFVLDWIDSEIFKRAGYSKSRYNLWDKFLDYYWYVLIIIYLGTIKLAVYPLFLLLFVYRSLGQFLYFVTKNELYFFLFPNIFEILFYFYLISTIFLPLQPFFNYPNIFYLLLVVIPLVLFREYVVHIKKMNLSGFFTGKTTYWTAEPKR